MEDIRKLNENIRRGVINLYHQAQQYWTSR